MSGTGTAGGGAGIDGHPVGAGPAGGPPGVAPRGKSAVWARRLPTGLLAVVLVLGGGAVEALESEDLAAPVDSSKDSPLPPGSSSAREATPAAPDLVDAAFDPAFFPVHFAPGESRLTIDSRALLEYMAKSLLSASSAQLIRIEGRSDGTESSPYGNTLEGRLELSRARAKAVRDYLVSRGIDSTRFVVVGLGVNSPLGALETAQDRDRNRVVLLSRSEATPLGPEGGVIRLSAGRRPEVAGSAGGGEHSPGPTGGAVDAASPAGADPAGAGPAGTGGRSGSPDAATSSATGSVPGSDPSPAGTHASRTDASSDDGDQYRDTGRSAMVASEVNKSVQTGPAIVQTVQLSLRILRREGPGAVGKGGWSITGFLQEELPNLEQLFRNGLSRERALVGETRLYVTLDAAGIVQSVTIHLPYPQDDFARELERYVRSWELPTPPGRDAMSVELAITVYATFQNLLAPIR